MPKHTKQELGRLPLHAALLAELKPRVSSPMQAVTLWRHDTEVPEDLLSV